MNDNITFNKDWYFPNSIMNGKPNGKITVIFEEEGRLGVTTSKKTYSFSPDSKDLQLERPEEHKLILGGECTLWTEMLPHSRTAEYLLFPRFCAAAETFWLPEEKKDFEDFKDRLPLHKELLHRLNYRFYEGPLE